MPDQGGGDQPDQRKDQRQGQAAAGAHSEKGGGNDGRDDHDSQPCTSGFDVRHEVHEGAGEFRAPGDALTGYVRVTEDQHGDRGERPDGTGGRGHGQRPGEGRMLRGVPFLGPGAAPVPGEDADGEDKAADHGGYGRRCGSLCLPEAPSAPAHLDLRPRGRLPRRKR